MANRIKPVWGASPYTPEVFQGLGTGVRASVAKLIKDLDPESAEFAAVCETLREMRNAGVEITEATVAIAVKMGRHRHDAERARQTQTLHAAEPHGLPGRLWPEEGEESAIVYYVRRGGLIKIGTTTQPGRRFCQLVPDEILAWEPGGRREEQARHRQFAHLRLGGEYFRPGKDLQAHCRSIRKLHGAPDPRWRTTNRIVEKDPQGNRLQLPIPSAPDLVTASQAAEILGIKRSTIASWVRRKLLTAVDGRTRPLYYLDHIKALDARRRRRQAASPSENGSGAP